MKRTTFAAIVLIVLTSACGGGPVGRSVARTVFVDFSHDQFSSGFLRNFPNHVEVHPGDELVFRQSWTGEPHTVTGGRLADTVGRLARPFTQAIREGKPLPGEPPEKLKEAMRRVGEAFVGIDFAPTASQPCFLRSGEPPKGGKACPKRKQPAFDGRFSLYSSGVIPYEGPSGNAYNVPFSSDVKPGKYFFYCVVHGPIQFTEVVVKEKGAEIPSAEQVSRAARSEVQRVADPLFAIYKRAVAKNAFEVDGTDVTGPFSGLYTPKVDFAQVNQFVPGKVTTKVGRTVSWKVFGGHTISFNVPEYFPIMEFKKNGEVHVNPRLRTPAGGAPALRQPEGSRPQAHQVDAGTWDGKGFWSSGEIYGQPYVEYGLRVSTPGTYRIACLIHPAMVGTLVVTR
jgi:plastocyanin